MSCKFFSLSTYDDTRNACLHHIDEQELATYLSVLLVLHDEYHPNKSPTHCLRVCPTAAAAATTVATVVTCLALLLLLLLLSLATVATFYCCHYCCSLPLLLLVTLLLPATILFC